MHAMKERLTVTLDGDVVAAVTDMCAAQRMSMSGMVNWLLASKLGLSGDMVRRPDSGEVTKGTGVAR